MTSSHLIPMQGSGKLPDLPPSFDWIYEFPSVGGSVKRKLTPARWNGDHYSAAYLVYTAEQMHEHGKRCAEAVSPKWLPIDTVPATADDVLLLTQSNTVRIETGHYARNMLAACKVDGDDCHFVRWMPVPSTSVQGAAS